jgi:VWFA-related protein
MKPSPLFGWTVGVCLAASAALVTLHGQGAQTRTVPVTVVDEKGGAVPDLTPADFVVKEGGKDREIVKVEHVTAPLQIALAVEDSLTSDTNVRMALGGFIQRTYLDAEIALVTIGRRAVTLVDYTKNGQMLVDGINKFGLNPATQDDAVTEGVFELARNVGAREGRRIIVLVAIEGQQSSGMSPDQALDELRKSGAAMFVATLPGSTQMGAMGVGAMSDESSRAKALGEGPRQSGGRRQESPSTSGIPRILQAFAEEMKHQYVVTYTLPDGTKPSDRISVTMKKKGLTLRAPTRIPNN